MNAEVQLDKGRIKGLAGAVQRYFGIPYAEPPVGRLRWQPPKALSTWQGTRNATSFGPDSFQQHDVQLRGSGMSEDCLYLNVWTPAQTNTESLPVMVWIHGNGYTRGSGSHAIYDGSALAERGVVVVTINYRLGLAGFLAHPELSAESATGSSGNYGLMDQIAALEWVQANIHAFGGDPRRVTIFGQSAGATCINLLMANEVAHGLYSQAILHSPGSMRPMATLKHAEQAGLRVGASIDELRSLPISALWPKASALVPAVRSLASPRGMGPIIDGVIVKGDDMANYRAGRIKPIPLMVGTTANEGRRLTERMPMRSAADVIAYQASSFGSAEHIPTAYRVTQPDRALELLDEVVGDTQFNYGAWSSAREMRRLGGQVYRYRFDRPVPDCVLPPTHDDELPYVFGTLAAGDLWSVRANDVELSADDSLLSKTMGDAWVAFASNGVPSAAGLPAWTTAADDSVMLLNQFSAIELLPPSTGLTSLQRYFGHDLSAMAQTVKEA